MFKTCEHTRTRWRLTESSDRRAFATLRRVCLDGALIIACALCSRLGAFLCSVTLRMSAVRVTTTTTRRKDGCSATSYPRQRLGRVSTAVFRMDKACLWRQIQETVSRQEGRWHAVLLTGGGGKTELLPCACKVNCSCSPSRCTTIQTSGSVQISLPQIV